MIISRSFELALVVVFCVVCSEFESALFVDVALMVKLTGSRRIRLTGGRMSLELVKSVLEKRLHRFSLQHSVVRVRFALTSTELSLHSFWQPFITRLLFSSPISAVIILLITHFMSLYKLLMLIYLMPIFATI